MGVIAGLIRYPGEVFAQVKAERTFYPPDGRDLQQCFLSRSWDELHPAFRTFGRPLSLALNGDYGYDGGLDEFGWSVMRVRDHYLGFVSPPLVARIAARLRTLSFEQLAEQLGDPSRGRDYLAPRYRDLVELYEAAAAHGDCVFVHVA